MNHFGKERNDRSARLFDNTTLITAKPSRGAQQVVAGRVVEAGEATVEPQSAANVERQAVNGRLRLECCDVRHSRLQLIQSALLTDGRQLI